MILATTLLTNATMDVHLRIFVPIAIITDGPARPPPSLRWVHFGIIARFTTGSDRYDRYRRRNEPGHGRSRLPGE